VIVASRRVEELFEWMDEQVLLFDGMDEALIGWARPMNSPTLAVYDYNLMVEEMMRRDGCTMDEAVEFVDFNVVGAYMGPETPIVMYRPEWVDVRFATEV
jgi:hypothetical protein